MRWVTQIKFKNKETRNVTGYLMYDEDEDGNGAEPSMAEDADWELSSDSAKNCNIPKKAFFRGGGRIDRDLFFSSFAMVSTTTTAREHVEEIRRKKFSIGGEPNPLTEDLHQAVKNLSAELYTKDIHFLMELIQVPGVNHRLFLAVKPLTCIAHEGINVYLLERKRMNQIH
ncbi:unnamed protein product [Lactuca virosa]|uniref:Uncharacterized protein n=1 Tax=Lactuca virosa TaxID=75947 RepID=A0AAU9MQZ5_9ASTR|nr:unnamed protein product [Lactuca virosa]